MQKMQTMESIQNFKTNLPRNRFELLASDSDSDTSPEVAKDVPEQFVKELQPSAKEVQQTTISSSPQFRTWSVSSDQIPSRFSLQDQGKAHGSTDIKHIFQSPFSKNTKPYGNKRNYNARPRFEKDDEGWVSIGCRKEEEPFVPKSPEWSNPPVPQDPVASLELDESAQVWAERVRGCLEKAEEARIKPITNPTERLADIRNNLNNLSFFRRPMVVDGSKPMKE